MNNSSLNPDSFRSNAKESYLKMLDLCVKYQVPVILNSDAHVSFDVGNLDNGVRLLEELNFPEHLVANSNKEMLVKYLKYPNL